MKPISNMVSCIGVTAALLLAGSFLASEIPVSVASEMQDRATASTNGPANVLGRSGLIVEITRVRNSNGKVVIFVFDDANAFEEHDYERAAAYAETAAATGTLKAQFPDLPFGNYAVSLFHDENGDDEFNMDGMNPLEGYGTSGARNAYDEPGFERASSDAARISVQIRYLQ